MNERGSVDTTRNYLCLLHKRVQGVEYQLLVHNGADSMGLFNKRKSSKKKGVLLSPDEDIGGNISPVSSHETKKSSKKSVPAAVPSTSALNDSQGQQPNPVNSVEASPPRERAPPVERAPSTRQRSMKQQQKEQRTNLNNLQAEPTMDMVHELVDDLATSTDTSGHQAARALRMLFALSEHASNSENRIAMVREADGQLVPVLLEFLRRCKRTSSEQYLALLVLNNVSIPSENKRIIAIDCGGVHVLSRLLCEDPSCHLMAIILVNLSFADVELRKELVSPNSSMQLVDALSYVLRVASRTPEEHNARKPIPIGDTNGTFPPRKLLAAAMLEDQRHHVPNDFGNNNEQNNLELFDPAKELFPETARWCLCALKNLTRPSKDSLVAQTMIGTGIMPLILRVISIGSRAGLQSQTGSHTPADSNVLLTNSSSRTQSPSPADPLLPQTTEVCTLSTTHGTDQASTDTIQECLNNPSTWDANSIQDAALFTVLNMAAIPTARTYLRENDAVRILLLIADYGSAISHTPPPAAQTKQRQFQSLKARMALSYLIGSEGHYGQPRSLGSAPPSPTQPEDLLLQITLPEAHDLVALLANTLHQRAKEGPGGYSAATFTVKGILSAIRYLLTLDKNQKTFATASAAKLNALLLKALAQHAVQRALTIDPEAAEHACFSLYLMSNFGFENPFLSSSFGESDQKNNMDTANNSLLVKVLTSYLRMGSITAAGRHAADQLMLRCAYLRFNGSTLEMENSDGSGPSASDWDFNEDLLCVLNTIIVEKQMPGAKPLSDIFKRPILRSRAAKKDTENAPWENRSSTAIFPSALHAVQQLSFGSTKVLHVDAIDEIVIANNIAKFANGEQSESYNYCWSWEEDAFKPQKTVSRQRAESPSQLKNLITKAQKQSIQSQRDDGPISIFGFKCGTGFCATDTTNTGSK